MRSKALMIIGIVVAILLGCISKNEDKSTLEVVTNGKNKVDTLIYSNPQNYSNTLESGPDVQNIEVRNYKDLFELYEKLNYTPEAWQSGIREVPRVYLPIIGDRWGSGNSEEVTTDNKKRLFFRTLAPLILRSNELILKDRDRLGEIRSSLKQSNSISKEDQTWIVKLAKVYKVEVKEDEISVDRVDELWKKVDIVPVSLALAQAAEESGWGTSRFAALGNAVYGQWTWGSNAIIPENQRKEKGNYGIASFENLQQSICAYMLNLNTHRAYSSLRDKRAELRRNNEEITGYILAGQLTKYSERGEEYVKSLRGLMDYNQLIPTDEAYLSSSPIIYLVPVAN
ncbi:glucosaminidase domain-containing protein [Algoriphagus lutimaris]|uniref:glucosaminidase domain-containing protein n=1 Tax=Algoriphagus lutimaris TaxID=613197 RepID=UPI00196AAB61|nr:glucosaminidase domain-containing protein [Algoriphagus lutimaris]MBN3521171.1 glucosaminidase domain-containing protein [Algoriphagus lutimaris]